MTFSIDTDHTANVYGLDHCDMLLQMARDDLPEDATQAQIDDHIAQLILGDLRQPKILDTVRGHLLRYWPLIAPLAQREPEIFDSILSEYVGLSTSLPFDRSEAIRARRNRA